ncbi:MAG: hypothetical protein MUP44_03660 [Anaerolineales bacterium]|nr:hypothetical protein [Anaerolineales bacterium]
MSHKKKTYFLLLVVLGVIMSTCTYTSGGTKTYYEMPLDRTKTPGPSPTYWEHGL